MLEYLAYTPRPVVFWLVLIVLNCAAVALGLALRRPLGLESGAPPPRALDVTQGITVSLAALILAFSFSFASARLEGRRLLIVQETNNIGTTYLRASYLPAGPADRFRSILRDYTRARLAKFTTDSEISKAMERKSIAMQDALWSIAVTAARAEPRNVQLGLLTQTLNDTIDVSTAQAAALRNHMPTAVLGLVLVVTLTSMIILGVYLAGRRWHRIVLALLSALLLATVVTEIVDLDRPLHGIVRVDLTPLQTQLQSMQ